MLFIFLYGQTVRRFPQPPFARPEHENVTVPENASRRLHHRKRINPDYDENRVYIPRDKRKEWGAIGLLGKVRVRDESPKHPNWKYLKTIAGKKLWLIK